jgi:hypothetical protein
VSWRGLLCGPLFLGWLGIWRHRPALQPILLSHRCLDCGALMDDEYVNVDRKIYER